MTNPETWLLPQKLIRECGTRDPFQLAADKGAVVMMRDDFDRQKGAFSIVLNVPFIFINDHLSDEMKRIVCAHELGHALLHRRLCKKLKNQTIYEYELFDIHDNTEYEANIFAASLLVDEEDLSEYLSYGYDLVQIARAMNVNVNLILIKFYELKERYGINYPLPYIPKKNFLGTIEDNAGEL